MTSARSFGPIADAPIARASIVAVRASRDAVPQTQDRSFHSSAAYETSTNPTNSITGGVSPSD